MASSDGDTRETGDGSPPTEQAKVKMDKGNVSQDAAAEIVRILLNSAIPSDQLHGIKTLYELLKSRPSGSDSFQRCVDVGTMKNLVQLLKRKSNGVQVKVTGLLQHVCSGPPERCEAVVNAGAVSELIKLLCKTNNPTIANNCIRCLQNIAIDFQTPDVVLRQGIIPALMKWAELCPEIQRKGRGTRKLERVFRSRTPKPVAAVTIINLYSELCVVENPDPNDLSELAKLLPILKRVFIAVKCRKSLASACEAVAGLTKDIKYGIPVVVNSGICDCLAKLLLHPDPLVATKALIALTNASMGSGACDEKIRDSGVLPKLSHLLKNAPSDVTILEDVYLLIRNMCIGNRNQIQQIIDAQLIPKVIQAAKEGDANTMLHATVAIYNMTDKDGGSLEQLNFLLEEGAVEALCYQWNLLTDDHILWKKLDALGCLLDRVKDQVQASTKIMSVSAVNRVVNAGAVPDLIELLHTSENLRIVKACIWCILSITSDTNNRDVIVPEQVIKPLVRAAEQYLENNLKKIVTEEEEAENAKIENDLMIFRILRLYRNLYKSRDDRPIQFSVLEEFIPVLTRILGEFQDSEILDEACEALFDLACDNTEGKTVVMESGVYTTLVELLTHQKPTVARNALRAVLSLSEGSRAGKEQIVKSGVVAKLVQLLDDSADNGVLESIYMVIGNLLEGIPGHIQPVIKANLFPKIIQAAKEKVCEVRVQAIKAIEAVASKGGGSLEQVNYLLKQGALQAIYYQLSVSTEDENLRDRLIKLANFLEHVRKKQNLFAD